MSQQLISHSPDLKRLRDEGYEVEIRGGYLVVNHVPYVASGKLVQFGALVSGLELSGDITTSPTDHVVRFIGDLPCDQNGVPLEKIINSRGAQDLGHGLVVNFSFSSKPAGGYPDYFAKMSTYAAILSGPAQAIDPTATTQSFAPIEEVEGESPFCYLDTASSRIQLTLISSRLELPRVAIVGLGGTGSYILDLVAKTPVREIHLFDGDRFLQHNAFRCPGAASIDELRSEASKVDYLHDKYSKMHKGIVPHGYFLDESNADELRGMDFVFLSLDGGLTKKALVVKLEELSIPFVDVGMGVEEVNVALMGQVRVVTSTPGHPAHVWDRQRISFREAGGAGNYDRNIQIADLNSLNAALAVIKWKKLFGFYHDLEHEQFSIYAIDGNHLLNEDQA